MSLDLTKCPSCKASGDDVAGEYRITGRQQIDGNGVKYDVVDTARTNMETSWFCSECGRTWTTRTPRYILDFLDSDK